MSNGIGIDAALVNLYVGYFLKSGIPCPNCQTEMLIGKGKPGQPNHMEPMCPACYYSVKAGKVIGISGKYGNAAQWQAEAHKRKAKDYYNAFSVFSNSGVQRYTLTSFQLTDVAKVKMSEQATKALRAIRDGKIVHAIFAGPTGVGKTHVAHGILLAAMAATTYEQKGFFLDWQEYLSITRDAIGGTQEVKQRLNNLQTAA